VERLFKVKKEYWESGNIIVFNDDETIEATLKWDGCVDYRKSWNGYKVDDAPEGETNYIHICDLNEFIEQLQELKRMALEHFKDKSYYE
jgi:hypothetical protein